jgi:RNA polymerase sigma-70 factor, ECF subfamily
MSARQPNDMGLLPKAFDCQVDHGNDEFLCRIEAYCRARVQGVSPSAEEQESWDVFFHCYREATRRIAQKVGLRGGDIDDCLQDAWTEVFLQLASGGFDPQRGRLYSWIFSLVRNKAVDLIRSQRPRASLGQEDLDVFPSSRELDPAAAYERKRDYRILHSALNSLVVRLSPATFQTLYGHWIEEKSCAEMASELGMTAKQVRYRRRRAKQILRQLLRQWSAWPDDEDESW